jgi:hypothetical protein
MKTKFKNGDTVYFIKMKFFVVKEKEFCKNEIIKGVFRLANFGFIEIVTPLNNGKNKVTQVSPNSRHLIFCNMQEAKEELKKMREETLEYINEQIDIYSKASKKLERMINEN